MKRLIFIFICIVFLVTYNEKLVFSQVRVVRTTLKDVPQTTLQKVPIEKIIKERERFIRFSSRVNLGYQMTKDTLGKEAQTFRSLSTLSFLTLFGLKSDISLGKQNLTNGSIQDVGLGMNWQNKQCSVAFNIKNSQKENIIANKLNQDETNNISLFINLGFIKKLPMSITYSRSENISKSPGTETQKNQSESLSCGIQSTAFDDKLSWNLRFSSGITEDLLADRKTKNYDISLGFGLPIITDKLSVNFSISPYNFTKNYLPVGDYTEINQQNYNTSFNFRISERLNTSFGISLNRSKSRINGTTEVTSSALGNDLNLAYRLKNLNISYNLNLTKSNNSRTESNLININILPPIKRISNINLSYGLVRTKSSDIIRRKSQNFSLTSGVINLTEHTNLNLGINLSLPEEDVRNSQINVGMWYSIGKLSTGFNFSDNRRKEKGALVNKSQNYQINLGHHGITVFKKSIPISLSHTYNIAGITKDQKSKSQSLNFSTSLPITQRINFGYAYSWNKSDKTKSNINNFNLRLSGEKRAYSLDTSLKLIKTNNDKLREDVALSFEYPLAKDLSLSTGLYFTSQDKEEPLYNFTSGLVYSF